MNPVRANRAAAAATIAAALLASGAAGAEPRSPTNSLRGAEGGPTMAQLYRVTGVRDNTGFGTIFLCTNVGGAPASILVVVFEFDGTVDCNVTDTSVAPGATTVLATRPTAAYAEDAQCAVAPGTNQGSALIDVDTTGSTDVICTVLVLDPAGVTPVFAERLPLYTPAGVPLENFIFADGFEGENTSRWTLTVP